MLVFAITAAAASISAPPIESVDPCTKPRALTCCASIEGDSDAYPTNPEGKLAFGCRHPRGSEDSPLSWYVFNYLTSSAHDQIDLTDELDASPVTCQSYHFAATRYFLSSMSPQTVANSPSIWENLAFVVRTMRCAEAKNCMVSVNPLVLNAVAY